VSDRKSASGQEKRKPYTAPTVTKLTPQQAKSKLEAQAIPGDKQAERLLKEIDRKLKSKSQYILLGLIFAALAVMPAMFLVMGVSNIPVAHGALGHLAPLWAAAWAVLGVWATLNATSICGLIGAAPDPGSPLAFSLAALGALNTVAALLFLFLSKTGFANSR
jgi:hypothetical protein